MTDIERLPPRLTTREVAALARITPKTLLARIKARVYDLKHVDSARQRIFRRDDVLRALGMSSAPSKGLDDAPIRLWAVNPDAIRAARSQQRAVAKHGMLIEACPPKPLSVQRHRAIQLSRRSGIRVTSETDDGPYDVRFCPRRNARASDWPAVIQLPRANPRLVGLQEAEEFDQLRAEADELREECWAALRAERDNSPKSAR